jgi:hypothetical protein
MPLNDIFGPFDEAPNTEKLVSGGTDLDGEATARNKAFISASFGIAFITE